MIGHLRSLSILASKVGDLYYEISLECQNPSKKINIHNLRKKIITTNISKKDFLEKWSMIMDKEDSKYYINYDQIDHIPYLNAKNITFLTDINLIRLAVLYESNLLYYHSMFLIRSYYDNLKYTDHVEIANSRCIKLLSSTYDTYDEFLKLR